MGLNYSVQEKASVSLQQRLNLPDKVNDFYARLDREKTSTPVPPPCDNDPPCLVTKQKRALKRLNINKAAEPNNISPRLLKTWSNQLSSIPTFIFNWSLTTSTIQLCFNQSTFVPVSKKLSREKLNDYRSVAPN
ncbi:hypothetical protein ElyMa_003237100 [Elysia marginata]|uniref:Uncharacterized protein n=1 Tax=Elysia marginata TaxID=1093978 RepID=A0AAV4J7S6_9GAST|nr:hypothetical protein ElyMa_003237100 [Elysia marginata]